MVTSVGMADGSLAGQVGHAAVFAASLHWTDTAHAIPSRTGFARWAFFKRLSCALGVLVTELLE
jgi:hypothetical protein